jgi:hypothetical protein
VRFHEIGQLQQRGAGHPTDQRGCPYVEPAVLLLVYADVVAPLRRGLWGWTVRQGSVEVLLL